MLHLVRGAGQLGNEIVTDFLRLTSTVPRNLGCIGLAERAFTKRIDAGSSVGDEHRSYSRNHRKDDRDDGSSSRQKQWSSDFRKWRKGAAVFGAVSVVVVQGRYFPDDSC